MKKENHKCPEIENIKGIAEDFFEKVDTFIQKQKEYNEELKKIRG